MMEICFSTKSQHEAERIQPYLGEYDAILERAVRQAVWITDGVLHDLAARLWPGPRRFKITLHREKCRDPQAPTRVRLHIEAA